MYKGMIQPPRALGSEPRHRMALLRSIPVSWRYLLPGNRARFCRHGLRTLYAPPAIAPMG